MVWFGSLARRICQPRRAILAAIALLIQLGGLYEQYEVLRLTAFQQQIRLKAQASVVLAYANPKLRPVGL